LNTLYNIFAVVSLRSINIVDNMLEKLEKHTKYLEKIVDEKNDELAQEKKNLEKLLYNILPK